MWLIAAKFKIIIDKERTLFLTHPFGVYEGRDKDEILFSFFINRKPILSSTTKLSEFADGFNQYLSSKDL